MDVPEFGNAGGSDHSPGRADPAADQRALASYLRRARRALRARRFVESQWRLFPFAIALVAATLAALRLASSGAKLDVPTIGVVAAAGLLAWLAASLVVALLPRYSPEDVALLVDRSFGTREVVATATWMASAPTTPSLDDTPWAARALAAIGGRRPHEAFPRRPLGRRRLAGVLAGAVVVAAILLVPPPPGAVQAATPATDAVVLETIEKVSEEIEQLAQALESRPEADSAKQVLEDLREQVEELKRSPQSKEETLLALERLDQVAADTQARRDAAETGALQRALSSLEQAALTREAARAAMDGDAEKLEKELQALAKKFAEGTNFDEREGKRLAARLREAAEALCEAGSCELGKKMEQLADAIEKGDLAEAARLAEELASSGEMQQLMSELQGDKALGEARQVLQQALAAMGRPQPGEAPKPGEGDPAQGGLSVDWGVGSTNEAEPGGGVGKGNQQDRQSAETSDWREAYEALYESQRLDGTNGRATRVHGEVGEGEYVAVPTRTAAADPQEATAPLVRLPARYEQAREEAMAREDVPAGYQQPVRRYFSTLGRADEKAPSKPPEPAPKDE